MFPLVVWDSVTKLQDANAAYNWFLEIFPGLYDIAFSAWTKNQNYKKKTLNDLLIAKGLQSSSKIKQKIMRKIFWKTKQNQWKKIQDM